MFSLFILLLLLLLLLTAKKITKPAYSPSSQLRVPLVAVTVGVFQGALAVALALVALFVLEFLAPLALERVGVVVMVVIPPRRALG